MGSVRRKGEHVRVSLDAVEVALVITLTSQVMELLGDVGQSPDGAESLLPDGEGSLAELLESTQDPVAAPRDPALLRLLPDAYRDDDDAAGEFRRLTEADLRAAKHEGLGRIVRDLAAPQAVQRSGGVRLDLDDEAAAAWLTALNDVRLAFGTRIEVSEDMDDERMNLPVDSQRYAEIATYDWFSWLQDAMLRALIDE
jgi:Domain of unknown function (DUF2017)